MTEYEQIVCDLRDKYILWVRDNNPDVCEILPNALAEIYEKGVRDGIAVQNNIIAGSPMEEMPIDGKWYVAMFSNPEYRFWQPIPVKRISETEVEDDWEGIRSISYFSRFWRYPIVPHDVEGDVVPCKCCGEIPCVSQDGDGLWNVNCYNCSRGVVAADSRRFALHYWAEDNK